MAEPRKATVVGVEPQSAHSRVIRLQMCDSTSLGHRPGQYIIVDSGVVADNGKRAKRAYSVIGDEVDHFMLAVYRIENGPGSNYMHRLRVGDVVTFSGPWGKFCFDDDSSKGNVAIIATDTGITAALGLMKDVVFQELPSSTHVRWYCDNPNVFLSDAAVRNLGTAWVHREDLPPLGSANRHSVAVRRARDLVAEKAVDRLFLSGDGAVNRTIRDALVEKGFSETHIRMESFFNHEKRKSTYTS